MRIQHSELVRIYQMLMNVLSKNIMFGKEINFIYDFYWDVPIGERQDVLNKPELDIGSIEHDLERIKQCLQDNDPMPCHFRWLGSILIAVADTIEHSIQQGESTRL